MLSLTLQGRDPDLGRLEVQITGADRQHLGEPRPGVRERCGEGLHCGTRVRVPRRRKGCNGGRSPPQPRQDNTDSWVATTGSADIERPNPHGAEIARWPARVGGVRPRAVPSPRPTSAGLAECSLAHDGLELAQRREVLGGAPGDEPRAVAEPPEPDGQGLQEPAREAVEEGEREPGEVGAVGHHEEAGGARAQDGSHARGHGLAQAFEERVERRAAVAGRRGCRPVEVDPRVAREVAAGDGMGIPAHGDDGGVPCDAGVVDDALWPDIDDDHGEASAAEAGDAAPGQGRLALPAPAGKDATGVEDGEPERKNEPPPAPEETPSADPSRNGPDRNGTAPPDPPAPEEETASPGPLPPPTEPAQEPGRRDGPTRY